MFSLRCSTLMHGTHPLPNFKRNSKSHIHNDAYDKDYFDTSAIHGISTSSCISTYLSKLDLTPDWITLYSIQGNIYGWLIKDEHVFNIPFS